MKVWPIVGLLASIVLMLSLPGTVRANEGRISLRGGSVSCEGVSVWESDRYHLVGRCHNLTYPYGERQDRYWLWIQGDGETDPTRVEEVERGLFDAQTDKRFTNILITAEEDSSPRQPSGTVVASGNVSPYNFSAQPTPAEPQPANGAALLVTPTPTIIASRTGILGNTSLATNVIIVVVILLVIFGIFSFLRR